MTLKSAALTLTPSARVASAVVVNQRLRLRPRTAPPMSLINIWVEERIVVSAVRTQRDGGIHARRSPGGEVARDHRDESEENGNARERYGVVHAHAEQEALEQPRASKRPDEAQRHTGKR